jgi:small subunit ribosomal protein S7
MNDEDKPVDVPQEESEKKISVPEPEEKTEKPVVEEKKEVKESPTGEESGDSIKNEIKDEAKSGLKETKEEAKPEVPVADAESKKEKPSTDEPMSKEERIELLSHANIPPLFGKYDVSEVQVNDPSLVRYINLSPVVLPHTEAKYTRREFGKHKMNIVERLMNNMMRTEKYTGKKIKTYKVVRNAFEIIEKRTKKNPVQVLVDALSNAAPMEEITRLQFGGISVQKAVDTSSARRLDIALRNICKGAVKNTYKTRKPIEQCLAEEIILASKGDATSWAVGRKEEIERVAASSR